MRTGAGKVRCINPTWLELKLAVAGAGAVAKHRINPTWLELKHAEQKALRQLRQSINPTWLELKLCHLFEVVEKGLALILPGWN